MNKLLKPVFLVFMASVLAFPPTVRAQHALSPEEVKDHPAFIRDVIIIDAGHGGIDGGTSFQNIMEKDINLAIAQKVFMLLRSMGYHAVLNRTGDYALSEENHWLGTRSRHLRDLAQRRAQPANPDPGGRQPSCQLGTKHLQTRRTRPFSKRRPQRPACLGHSATAGSAIRL